MDVNELLARAWAAVEKSGVPEPLQPLALKEAIDFLRGEAGPLGSGRTGSAIGRRGRSRSTNEAEGRAESDEQADAPPSEDAFFAELAAESGQDEGALRDVLQLTADGKVQVTAPTRNLGASTAEQAKNVIALVAGARGIGLRERPVSAGAVREELERKRCYNVNHFASKHLGPLKGFNAGSNRAQIVLTSKWPNEFGAAVSKVHGREPSDSQK
jgi:hypothetical protein